MTLIKYPYVDNWQIFVIGIIPKYLNSYYYYYKDLWKSGLITKQIYYYYYFNFLL